MRNMLAFIIGIITTITILTVTLYVLANYNIDNSKQIFNDIINSECLPMTIRYLILVIFPLPSVVSGFISSLIAKDNGIICGLISIIPLLIISYNFSFIHKTMTIIVILLSMSIGVIAARRLKQRYAMP